ncbi:hypothetical protein BJV78DRAFT_1236137 [Lactifluus subvellereus]|nr:hypothetical protein BJV78DRAFT_1236137 [Lactifluus subvellereus]
MTRSRMHVAHTCTHTRLTQSGDRPRQFGHWQAIATQTWRDGSLSLSEQLMSARRGAPCTVMGMNARGRGTVLRNFLHPHETQAY